MKMVQNEWKVLYYTGIDYIRSDVINMGFWANVIKISASILISLARNPILMTPHCGILLGWSVMWWIFLIFQVQSRPNKFRLVYFLHSHWNQLTFWFQWPWRKYTRPNLFRLVELSWWLLIWPLYRLEFKYLIILGNTDRLFHRLFWIKRLHWKACRYFVWRILQCHGILI